MKQNKLFLKRAMPIWLVLAFMLVLSPLGKKANAEEVQMLAPSIRALGMGNAFIAISNDESALFYNPAGLESVQQTIIEVLTFNAAANKNLLDLGDQDSDSEAAFIGDLVGNKMYLSMGGKFFSMTTHGFGYALFGNFTFDATIHNPVVPYFEALVYAQGGLATGFSMNFADHSLDLGFEAIYLSRSGIGKTIHIVDFLDDDFVENIEDEYVSEAKIAPTVGSIYHMEAVYNWETKIGVVARNIGGLEFGSTGGYPMTVDLGIATETEQMGIDIVMAADLLDATFSATEEQSIERNMKFGIEFGLWKRSNNHHALAFRFGRNGAYPTHGLSLNIPYFPLMIDYAHWSEELGTVSGVKGDERDMVQFSINF